MYRSIRRYLLLSQRVRDRPLPRSRDSGFSLGLAVTGLVLGYCSGNSALAVSQKALQYCLVIHFACAGLMAIFLPVHIYMAALAPGEGPALCSMLTGLVPLKHVCEHNPLWYAELKQSGKMVQTDTNTR
ncbi:MAG: hypothetical protein H9993_06640 [Candidatus Desulfovibrio faecigallinarum]|uniref:hypothetical protein n=1 Tax=Desulfovibrio sp. An276 TaxID=1965618 RepID=UPI000B36AF66|nr:hypothetical protein [Desulfovibrio sp. An276]MBU3832375.1 hypothetical protein [Candidatus Desulfovibrio faecigallinarum]OUO53439.1 hypothetical protein B5F76_05300 [Desulfovibrio sp. An276]